MPADGQVSLTHEKDGYRVLTSSSWFGRITRFAQRRRIGQPAQADDHRGRRAKTLSAERVVAAQVSSGLHGDGVFARAIGKSDARIIPF